jgi:hypothetical protein
MGGMLLARAGWLDGWAISLWSHWSADMNALWLMVFGVVAAALLLAALYAKPILAAGSAFSSPGPLPLPGRYFGRRLKRWWQDVAAAPLQPTGPPLRLGAWPILDLKAGRLAGLLLERRLTQAAEAGAGAGDLVLLERAAAHGRRLGWRHSSTAVIVPMARPGTLFANPRGRGWEIVQRYSGDEVATVPLLVLLVDDLAELPGEAILDRLARTRVGIALAADRLPEGSLPGVVERVFVKAAVALATPERVRALQTASRPVIVTGVPDMAHLERLAKAGLHFATGPVFGAAQVVE